MPCWFMFETPESLNYGHLFLLYVYLGLHLDCCLSVDEPCVTLIDGVNKIANNR